MSPPSEEEVSQLAGTYLSTADLSAFCQPDVSRIDTLQFIAQLRLSISHVATVLGRQGLSGEFFHFASHENCAVFGTTPGKVQPWRFSLEKCLAL